MVRLPTHHCLAGPVIHILKGMFLYAKLVLHVVKDYGTVEEIQTEVENLPDGLDKA